MASVMDILLIVVFIILIPIFLLVSVLFVLAVFAWIMERDANMGRSIIEMIP